MSCTDVGTIKYFSDAGSNGWVGYTNMNAGTWQEMPAADLDWDFAHAFNEACNHKDCTYEDILTCVAGALPPRPRLAHALARPPTQPPSAHPPSSGSLPQATPGRAPRWAPGATAVMDSPSRCNISA